MSIVQIDDYARQLYSAHGDRAEYEAAQKAKESAAKGETRPPSSGARCAKRSGCCAGRM